MRASVDSGTARASQLCTPARRARGRSSSSRRPSRSLATNRPLLRISDASARVFPPAPAQASTTSWPARASQASAMSWLPSSWTSNKPALKARSAKTLVRPVKIAPQGESRVGSTREPSARSVEISSSRVFLRRFARTVSGARWFKAPARPRVWSGPSCSLQSFASQRGSDVSAASASRGSSGTPSRAGSAISSSTHSHGATSGPASPTALCGDCPSPVTR